MNCISKTGILLTAAVLLGGCADERSGSRPGSVSEFGRYEGY